MDEETRTWALEAVQEVKADISGEVELWKAGEANFSINNLLALTTAGVHSLAEVVEALVREQPTD